jgi:soluble lytic murein transglycosylase-like protein
MAAREPARLPVLLVGLALMAPALAAVWHSSAIPAASQDWPDRYDTYFRKYTKHYFGPGFDWHWFKAQAIAESTLRADARSPTGARGLMQILPSTFAEIKKANPHFIRLDEPRWNIAAGIYYNRMLYDRWERSPLENRLAFTFGSYNAGYGGILRATRRAMKSGHSSERWEQVARHAPAETRAYVKRIRSLMGREG